MLPMLAQQARLGSPHNALHSSSNGDNMTKCQVYLLPYVCTHMIVGGVETAGMLYA